MRPIVEGMGLDWTSLTIKNARFKMGNRSESPRPYGEGR